MGLLGDILSVFEEDDSSATLDGLPVLPPSPRPRDRRAGTRTFERKMGAAKRAAAQKAQQAKIIKPTGGIVGTKLVTGTTLPGILTALAPRTSGGVVVTRLAPTGPSLTSLVTAGSTPRVTALAPSVSTPRVTALAPAPSTRPLVVSTAPSLASRIGSRLSGLGGPFDLSPTDAPDFVGVPPTWSPQGLAWVSQDVYEGLPDANVWHWRGKPMKMRFAAPVADMRELLNWEQYDEYGKIQPSYRAFDNKTSIAPDLFGDTDGDSHHLHLDDLKWHEHGPKGRAMDTGAVRILMNFNPGPKDENLIRKLNIGWDPADMSWGGAMAQAQLPFPGTHRGMWSWSQSPADFWSAQSGADPTWADPYRPMPIDLMNWYALHVYASKGAISESLKNSILASFADDPGLAALVASGEVKPDEYPGSARDFWAGVLSKGTDFGFIAGNPTQRQALSKGLDNWNNVDSGHPGRMLVTIYEPQDVQDILRVGGSLPGNRAGFSSLVPPPTTPTTPTEPIAEPPMPEPTPAETLPTEPTMGPTAGGNLPTEPSYEQPSYDQGGGEYPQGNYDPYGAYAAQYGDQNLIIDWDSGSRGDGFSTGGGLPDINMQQLDLYGGQPSEDFGPEADPYKEQAINVFDNQIIDEEFALYRPDDQGVADFYVEEAPNVDEDFATPSDSEGW
jgi:hypothetical protein